MLAAVTPEQSPIDATPTGTKPSQLFLAFMGLTLLFAVFAIYLMTQSLVAPPSRQLVAAEMPPEQVVIRLKAMSDAERQALVARERAAVAADPLDTAALKNLAALSDVAGDTKRAQDLTLLVGNRSLRDLPVQTAVLQILLARKDYVGALYRLDGLIRAKLERKKELLQVVASFADGQESLGPLVKLLTQNPPWRQELLLSMAAEPSQNLNTLYRLLATLRKESTPPTKSELRAFLQRLVNDKNYDRAYFVWLDSLSEVELRRVGLVFDGGFDLDISDLFFDWTYNRLPNVDVSLVPRAPGSVDRVLRVDFAKGRTPFAHFSQLLRLGPGDYLLSGDARSVDLKNGGGLVWRIYCLSDQPGPIVESSRLSGTMEWGRFEKPFTVPATNCETQVLRLELNARAELDYQISGRAFYDSIAILRREAAPAAQ